MNSINNMRNCIYYPQVNDGACPCKNDVSTVNIDTFTPLSFSLNVNATPYFPKLIFSSSIINPNAPAYLPHNRDTENALIIAFFKLMNVNKIVIGHLNINSFRNSS